MGDRRISGFVAGGGVIQGVTGGASSRIWQGGVGPGVAEGVVWDVSGGV